MYLLRFEILQLWFNYLASHGYGKLAVYFNSYHNQQYCLMSGLPANAWHWSLVGQIKIIMLLRLHLKTVFSFRVEVMFKTDNACSFSLHLAVYSQNWCHMFLSSFRIYKDWAFLILYFLSIWLFDIMMLVFRSWQCVTLGDLSCQVAWQLWL